MLAVKHGSFRILIVDDTQGPGKNSEEIIVVDNREESHVSKISFLVYGNP